MDKTQSVETHIFMLYSYSSYVNILRFYSVIALVEQQSSLSLKEFMKKNKINESDEHMNAESIGQLVSFMQSLAHHPKHFLTE